MFLLELNEKVNQARYLAKLGIQINKLHFKQSDKYWQLDKVMANTMINLNKAYWIFKNKSIDVLILRHATWLFFSLQLKLQ